MSPEKALQQAINFHRQGRFAEAESGYRAVLARAPKQFEALNYLGVLKMQQGDLSEAARLLSAAAAVRPAAADVQSNLGAVLTALGRHQEALAAFDRVVAAAPRDLDARFNRGVVLASLGRYDEALAAYDAVLAAKPGEPAALINRSIVLARLGRHAEALAACDRALAAMPNSPDALLNRGNVLIKLDRHADALAAFDRLLTINPNHVDTLNNRGIALKELGRYDEALAACDRALAIKPDHADAHVSRGNILARRGDHEAALEAFDRALQVRPDDPEALNNRGLELRELRRFGEALAAFDRALAIAPNTINALNNRGLVLFDLGRFAEARASYERALQIAPDYVEALHNRALVSAKLGAYGEAIADGSRALALSPRHPAIYNSLLNWRMTCCDLGGAADLAREFETRLADETSVIEPLLALAVADRADVALRSAQKFIKHRVRATPASAVRQPSERRGDRIRVAYVSADFLQHATLVLMAGLFEQHDRTRFEITAISLNPEQPSALRERVQGAVHRFVNVAGKSDREVAALLRELEIDIAVDLKGHTQDARLGIFAARPAPIQVSYLGYPGTVGADFIDYVVADPVVLPFDQQPFYPEKIVHLPDCYQVNDAGRSAPAPAPTRAEAGLPAQGFVFCCFNANFKITAAVFDVWMRLLQRVEGSVLWLLAGNELVAANLQREATARGVDPARLVFAGKKDLPEHLARHELAGLFLDTLPYNAHTTASDALWAGLPVVTCRGEAFAGRVAASLLQAVGLPELVTGNLEEYEALAVKLATEPGLLSPLRERLVRHRSTHPLFDTDRFRRHLEAAYTTMWDAWQRGEAPRSFAVDPLP